ncbi:hypothetical protein AgCh_017149 [Apium graveolens]
MDKSSEYTDKHSEADSPLSDDLRQHKEFFEQSRSAAENTTLGLIEEVVSRLPSVHKGHYTNDEFELLGFGDADSEERLSDKSDGVLSIATETDGSISSIVEYTLFPEASVLSSEVIAESTEPPAEILEESVKPPAEKSGRDLINMEKKRTNVIQIIEDARHPSKYRILVGMVDIIFSYVAQPDQECGSLFSKKSRTKKHYHFYASYEDFQRCWNRVMKQHGVRLDSESVTDIFSRFQKLLNALKLHGRVHQKKDSNLKFLRSLPKEWKPTTVSLRNSQDYKEFTLERLYGILKTYELEIEQDERIEKGRKKGGSIALVVELEKEKEMKVEVVESTSKICENKGKELVAKNEDHLSLDDMDDIDEHLAFLSRRFSKLKFKKNFGAAKPSRNMVDKSKFKCFKCGLAGHFFDECRKSDSSKKKFEPVDYKQKYFELLKQKERDFITQENDWVANGLDEDEDVSYVNLSLMAKSNVTETSSSSNQDELTESLKKEEILKKQLEREHEVIKAWKSSRDVHAQITKFKVLSPFMKQPGKRVRKSWNPIWLKDC